MGGCRSFAAMLKDMDDGFGLLFDKVRELGIEDHTQAPPIENFEEAAGKRVQLGLLIRQLISDRQITLDEADLRAHIEEMVAGYENPEDMVNLYLSNPQIVQQIEPMALEQKAIDWLLENGKVKSRKVSFKEYMKP